jgi:N-acetyl-anhydromuramyl-L-alanine amidase AmpD
LTSSLPASVAKLQQLRASSRYRRSAPNWPLLLFAAVSFTLSRPPAVQVGRAFSLPVPPPPPKPAFLADRRPDADLYSNGLEIRSNYKTTSTPRVYRTYDRATLAIQPPQTRPAGIVFHTTESLVAPMEADQIGSLTRNREDVLAHVRRDRLYNFVIDRFGQVFQVVPQDQTAYHAGHSIWADSTHVYIDLNESFLGVAFEMKAGEAPTAAQIHAGKLLTEVLRGAYGIQDANCVTHAQVSVNPSNLRIGFHTDWGGGFPFSDVGLTAGYGAPIAAVELFGFGYDEHLLSAIGGRPWQGLLAAEQQILIDAAAHGALGPRYRTTLQQQYRNLRRK